MKKILLTLVATTMLCLGVSAQKQYVMKITKANGETVELNADDIKDVTFVPSGTDPVVSLRPDSHRRQAGRHGS